MATNLDWLDGFGTYAYNSDSVLYMGGYLGSHAEVLNHSPRTGAACCLLYYQATFNSGAGYLFRSIPSRTYSCIGGAFKLEGTTGGAPPYLLIGFSTAANNPPENLNSVIYVGVDTNFNVYLCVVDSGGGKTYPFSTSNSPFTLNTYNYLELQINIPSEQVLIYLNGSLLATVNGLTFPFATATFGMCSAGRTVSVGNCLLADLYINSSSVLTDKINLGAQRAFTLFPSGDETGNEWVPSTGSTGYNLINNFSVNDSDYITGNNAGDASHFSMTQLPATNYIINGVNLVSVEAAETSGSATTHKTATIGAYTLNCAEETPPTSDTYYYGVFTLSGVQGSDVNAMTMGIIKDS